MATKLFDMLSLVNGTVIKRGKDLYFVSRGLDGRIITSQDGTWFFLQGSKNTRWLATGFTNRNTKIVFTPPS